MSALHKVLFTVSLTVTSRFVHVRDRMMGRVPRRRADCSTVSATEHTIASGKNRLDAVLVEPSGQRAGAAVLICHGIGEVVAQWFPIQRILAENGVASLVFDYSGYGRSSGFIDWMQCERDAAAAFAVLKERLPGIPAALLGFSLGSGIAPAILDRVKADRLVLCAGYASFRSAARSARIPGFLSALVPPIWSAEKALESCSLPILVVQGDNDGLFPMKMGHELMACCGPRAELLVLPAASHNRPFYAPTMDYWGPIAGWLLKPARA